MQMKFERERSSGYMTNWAARLFTRAIEQRLTPLGLSPAYMPVFFALGGDQAMSQTALARHAAVEQPTMAATLNRMERDGLIARRADPADGRSALVSLTPLAVEKMKQVQAAGRAVNETAMAELTADERELYLALLNKVVANLEASDEPD
jgi:MarR family transcriptional regulator for hemolysin